MEPRPWPRHRWWLLIVLVFAAHIGLIFAFGRREPSATPRPAPGPALRLAEGRSELLVNDPTLFALPHPKGFAAAAWLNIPHYDFPPFRWTEQREMGCPLPEAQLGAAFLWFMQTNVFPRRESQQLPVPHLTTPGVAPLVLPIPTPSTMRVAGELTRRPMLAPVEPPSWLGPGLLTNSVVEIWVDARGNVFSASLLPPGSGSKPADQWAVNSARTARFAAESPPPLFAANPIGRLTRGALIFEWRTAPATNTPPARP
jgi:hypothetical protein